MNRPHLCNGSLWISPIYSSDKSWQVHNLGLSQQLGIPQKPWVSILNWAYDLDDLGGTWPQHDLRIDAGGRQGPHQVLHQLFTFSQKARLEDPKNPTNCSCLRTPKTGKWSDRFLKVFHCFPIKQQLEKTHPSYPVAKQDPLSTYFEI